MIVNDILKKLCHILDWFDKQVVRQSFHVRNSWQLSSRLQNEFVFSVWLHHDSITESFSFKSNTGVIIEIYLRAGLYIIKGS